MSSQGVVSAGDERVHVDIAAVVGHGALLVLSVEPYEESMHRPRSSCSMRPRTIDSPVPSVQVCGGRGPPVSDHTSFERARGHVSSINVR